jgi:chloride channel 7
LLLLPDIEKCVKENCLYIPYLQWLGISCGFAFLASVLVTYGEPVAAGSGIPLVKCYLNGINVHRLHRLKTLFVKAAGVTCSVLGGLAVGKVLNFFFNLKNDNKLFKFVFSF